jgi:hypothetical protein
MGRSSNSSHYQLSANKLISRIHVRAQYIPTPDGHGKVTITCNGWNGMKVHCHGRSWDLGKGDSFTSETETADIMVDVHEARVFVAWPVRRERLDSEETESVDWSQSPPIRRGLLPRSGSSPIKQGQRLASPESPTPAMGSSRRLSNLFSSPRKDAEPVQVYEDSDAAEDHVAAAAGVGESFMTEIGPNVDLRESMSSQLSDPSDDDADPDEENDPIIHSFGPFGANIADRMARVTAGTPEPELERLSEEEEGSLPQSPSPVKRAAPSAIERPTSPAKQEPRLSSAAPAVSSEPEPFVNHVINQLAFSRLSSTPLSVILNNLPSELKTDLSRATLHAGLIATPCIGEIRREGKDAAGKPLESEFYYIPEQDDDEGRRAAVEGLRKPSLRSCRRVHKVSSSRLLLLWWSESGGCVKIDLSKIGRTMVGWNVVCECVLTGDSNTTGRSRELHRCTCICSLLHQSDILCLGRKLCHLAVHVYINVVGACSEGSS